MAQETLIDQLGNKEIKARYADKANTANTATEANSASTAKAGSTLETQLNQKELASNKKQSVDPTSETDYVSSKAMAEFVNSSVSLAAADYISDQGEPFTSVNNLPTSTSVVSNNDYAFVTGTDQAGNTYYDRYKATVSGNNVTWAKEFRLNNSSFTAAQWNAISSGVTAVLIASYNSHLENTDIHVTTGDKSAWNAKYDKPNTGIPSSDMTQAVQDSLTKADNSVQKVQGKDLSSNDFTNEDKSKLDGIEAGAEVNVQPDWDESDNTKDDFIKNKPNIILPLPSPQELGGYAAPTKAMVVNAMPSSGIEDTTVYLVVESTANAS